MELNKQQQEIREKLIVYALKSLKKDYNMTNVDLAAIFGMTRQAIFKIDIKHNRKEQ